MLAGALLQTLPIAARLGAVLLAANLGGTITTAVSLPAGAHSLTAPLTIAATGSLTLQAGATLTPTGSYGISVYGSLTATGTADAGCSVGAPTAGSWPGITVLTGGKVQLTDATLSGAVTGITDNGGLASLTSCQVKACSRDGLAAYNASEVEVADCQFSGMGRRGVYLETTAVTGSVGQCDFSQIGEYPVVAKAALVHLLAGPFTFSDAALPYVGVSCSADQDITGATTWPWLGYDYDLRAGSSDELDIAPGGDLTLAPGVRVRGGSITVEGTLQTTGSGAPVYLYGPSGDGGTAGEWPGITVAGGSLSLTGAVVRFASTAVTAKGGSVDLTGCSLLDATYDGLLATSGASLKLSGCTIARCGRSGLRLDAADLQGSVANTAISACGDWPVYALANSVGLLGAGLTFADNAYAGIGVNCDLSPDITRSQTWLAQPVPYDLAADPSALVATVGPGAALTLAAGVRVLDGGVEVQGRLVAAGTSQAPVVFSSSRQPAAPGDWPGLAFDAGSTGSLLWTTVDYAQTGLAITSASPTVTDCRLTNCSQDGLAVTGAGASPVIYATQMTNNGRYGVYIGPDATPDLGDLTNTTTSDDGQNTLMDNGGAYDLYSDTAYDIKAQHNWWGGSTSAAIALRIHDHAEDPQVGVVDYSSFLAGPPNTAPVLAWVGSGSYVASGVAPALGTPSTQFTWRVLYRDAEANPPQYVRVHVLSDGSEISGSPFDMTAESTSPDYAAGVVYTYSGTLPSGRAYTYFFAAEDWGLPATGAPTVASAGPVVTNPPTLSWTGEAGYESGGLAPASGFADDTVFAWHVKYTDVDGDEASGVFVHVLLNGADISGSPFEMTAGAGTPTSGQIYTFAAKLPLASADGYTYSFVASDGVMAATGTPTSPTAGPAVSYRPELAFTGAAGYEEDTVHPEDGTPQTQFQFAAVYTDLAGREPTWVRVHVTKDGVEVPGSPFTCQALDSQPVTAGRQYGVSLALPAARTYEHWFEANDGTYDAFGPATKPLPGPLSDQPPTLAFPASGSPAALDGLDPNSGGVGATQFLWRVVYSDADGDAPRYVALRLFRNGVELPGGPWQMTPVVGGDYKTGKTYELIKRITSLGTWTYRFAASDGYFDATGDPTASHSGPTVSGAFELDYPTYGGPSGDGVTPGEGVADQTAFGFSVTYLSPEDKAPTYVRLHYTTDGLAASETAVDLTAIDAHPFTQGRTYAASIKLGHGQHAYWFEASDGQYTARTDAQTGPTIDNAPVLSWVGDTGYESDGVDPDSGTSGQTLFHFRVKYTDPDGDAPQTAHVVVYPTSALADGYAYSLKAEATGDFSKGVVYGCSIVLAYSAEGLRYRFVFDDGYAQATGPPTQPTEGPTVAQPKTTQALLFAARAVCLGQMASLQLIASRGDLAVSGKILNLAGREVATVAGTVDPQTRLARLVWPYVSRRGTRVPPGVYLAVVTGVAPTGETCQQVVQLRVPAP